MALRHGRGAGLRRASSRRAGFVALGAALYLAAGVAATWPAVLHARSHFLSGGAPAHGEASPGDHLQSLYHYWLVGHQLEHGRAPWRDPFTFRPEAKPQPNFPGWPYGILFWPLGAVFGLVGGWNVLQILFYVLAGLAACAWLRELDLPRGPALAGGLAFAIAPYRVEQSVGHLLGPISILLPVSLWAFERARRGSRWWLALAGAALASIPLSGQVHLALGAIPFFFGYAVCRTRDRRLWFGAGAGAIAAIGAGLVVLTGGPKLASVGQLAGIRIPAGGVRHQVAVTERHPDLDPARVPMVFDLAAGLYWRPDEGGLLFGMSNPDEPPGENREVDEAYLATMRARLAARVPVTAGLGLRRVWAATIDYTPDHFPIIGRARDRVTVASAAGAGMMWGPGLGRATADVALTGSSDVLDTSDLGLDRFDEAGRSRLATDPIALPFPERITSS
jgi:hypothetical protein